MKRTYIHSLSALNAQCIFQEKGERKFPVDRRLSVQEPDYKQWIPDAGLRRRMSRFVRMGVATAMNCTGQLASVEIGGIITATGLGCLADTERFMNTILDNDEHLLNPTPFIQSTFNTIGAQIALLCRNRGYNMTYVHRGFSFESALSDAQMMIEEEETREILVGGVDELTDTGFRIMERIGRWRKGMVAGEGAHFFLLGKEVNVGRPLFLNGVHTFCGPLATSEVCEKIADFLRQQETQVSELGLLMSGRTGEPFAEKVYNQICRELFPGVPEFCFKQYGGEYPTAAAFGMWLAASVLKGERCWDVPFTDKNKVLIYNTYGEKEHSLILLGRE